MELAPYLTKAVPLKLQKAFSTAQVVHVGIGVGDAVGMAMSVGIAVLVGMAVSVGMLVEIKI